VGCGERATVYRERSGIGYRLCDEHAVEDAEG
jgi:hypothetical protein